MQRSDLPAAVAVSAAAFGVDLESAAGLESWRERVWHAVASDPAGAFVAERSGRVVGVAEAIRRDRLWVLSLLTVQPGVQSRGIGGQLLEAALGYAEGTATQLIVSSSDPRALRMYGLAGFALLPTFQARGQPRLTEPPVEPVTVVEDPDELAALAAISQEVRGGPHTPELRFLSRGGARFLRVGDRGFAAAHPRFGVSLLAARDESAARALLTAALAHVGAGDGTRPTVRWMTGDQGWAVDLVLRAGLELSPYGALCVRGERGTLAPYLPSPPFA